MITNLSKCEDALKLHHSRVLKLISCFRSLEYLAIKKLLTLTLTTSRFMIWTQQWRLFFYIIVCIWWKRFQVMTSLSAGPRLLHHELLHVHLLGSVLRLPGRLSGQGFCSVCLRLRNPRGEENHGNLENTVQTFYENAVQTFSCCISLLPFFFFFFKLKKVGEVFMSTSLNVSHVRVLYVSANSGSLNSHKFVCLK